ncbi:MAG: hypothetical protein PHW95_01255 [Patescibacteria group bacterium]|nr:hypothetical protein [Patescibacteria group bacterium]
MTIEKKDLEKIIQDIQVGNSVAENDFLLDDARVDTPIFLDVWNDKYDIIPGRKGAGKTAMFKILSSLSDFILRDRRIVILTGVDTAGEPVFNEFKNDFDKFSEDDFENFWKLYFVALIYNDFIKNDKFEAGLSNCASEIFDFKKKCEQVGIPEIPAIQDKKQIIKWILNRFPAIKKVKTSTVADIQNPTLIVQSLELEFKDKEPLRKSANTQPPLYVKYIGQSIGKILNKSNYGIWIILDRLDEVFSRYSSTEFNGLRGLLKAYKSFDLGSENKFRIKIFLRDDIKFFLTDAKIYKKFFGKRHIPPLSAATHIFSRESQTLSWSIDEIEQLILNRLLLSIDLLEYLGITRRENNLSKDAIKDTVSQTLRIKKKRSEYWDKIFPKKIQSTDSLKWIFTRLSDSNGIVTPRSVIDLLEASLMHLKKKALIDFEDQSHIFTQDSLKEGMDIASKYKLERDIYNEFPREQQNIKKLTDGKPKLSRKDLKELYGDDWESVLESLKRIGILKYIKSSNLYSVVFLYRPGLGIIYKY